MNGRIGIIKDLIARYIAAHPHAADTVDGICDWWVAPDLPDAVRAEVQAAADELVARGTLVKSALPEGTLFHVPATPQNGHSV
jgi:hypothetical protein